MSGVIDDDGLLLLQALIRDIMETNDNSLVSHLNLIDIEELSRGSFKSLLRQLLNTAFDNSNEEAIVNIIETLRPNYTDRYQLPLINSILIDTGLDDNVVSFVIQQFPQYSYISLANNFIQYDSDPDLITGLIRLEMIKGPLVYDDYKQLLDLSNAYNNIITEEFFSSVLSDISPYAPIPPWMIITGNIPDINPLLQLRQSLIFDLPENTGEIVDILTSGLRSRGQSIEDVEIAEMNLRRDLLMGNVEGRELVRQVLENKALADLSENKELFRLYGPANIIAGVDLTDNEVMCNKYGGCRMLTCIDFEGFTDYPIDDYNPQDWFTGVCQVCRRRIKSYWYALRLPLDHGGWRGCYCSEKCIRNGMTITLAEGLEDPNPLNGLLLGTAIRELHRIGIYER